MIHLITLLPLPYQQTLCRALSGSYEQKFVAWFAERELPDYPFQSSAISGFRYYCLSEVGFGKLFRELRADPEAIVILCGWSSPMTNKTLLMTTLLRIPVFIWADHPHPRRRPWILARARRLYLQLLARKVSGFLACGEPTVEHLISLGIDRGKITNFPYWVELPPGWAVPERCLDHEAARRPLRLIAIGRHIPVKRFEVAIEAVALANQTAGYDLAELIMIGDGVDRLRLEELARKLGCASVVSFTGWLESEEVSRQLKRADALIVASSFEPYGVVVLEAMANGRTVMASERVVAAVDRDQGTDAVIIHSVGDVNTLANQISSLAGGPDRLRQSSIAARATAQNWEPQRAAEILDVVFKKTKTGKMVARPTRDSVDPRLVSDQGIKLDGVRIGSAASGPGRR